MVCWTTQVLVLNLVFTPEDERTPTRVKTLLDRIGDPLRVRACTVFRVAKWCVLTQ